MIPDLNDPSSVGQICDLIASANLSWRSARQFDPAVKKLVNLLQGITEVEIQRLSPHRTKALVRALRYPMAEFALVALPIISKLAHLNALPVLNLLTDGRGAAMKRPDVQQAATACVATVCARYTVGTEKDTLLRSAVHNDGSNLLHPSNGDIDWRSLLRSGTKDNKE